MNIYNLIIGLLLTMIAYMGFPTYKFGIRKEINDINVRKKIIFWNSVVVAILFIIIRSIMYGPEFGIKDFCPALLYYYINLIIYARNNKVSSNIEEKRKKSLKKDISIQTYNLTYLIIICITIFITTLSSIFLFNYMQILKIKEEDKIINKSQLKNYEYDRCYEYVNKIYINIGTVDTKTGIISGEMTINKDSYDNFQKLKSCLEKAYKK